MFEKPKKKKIKKATSRKLQAKKELDKGVMKDYIGDKRDMVD